MALEQGPGILNPVLNVLPSQNILCPHTFYKKIFFNSEQSWEWKWEFLRRMTKNTCQHKYLITNNSVFIFCYNGNHLRWINPTLLRVIFIPDILLHFIQYCAVCTWISEADCMIDFCCQNKFAWHVWTYHAHRKWNWELNSTQNARKCCPKNTTSSFPV